jgi:hypothetical protein
MKDTTMTRFEEVEEEQEAAERNEKPKKNLMERLLETRTITIFGEIRVPGPDGRRDGS